MKASHPPDRCPDPSRVLDYVEGELPAREEAVVRSHLAACASCASEARRLADILALARSEPTPAPHAGAEARLRAAVEAALARRETGVARRPMALPSWIHLPRLHLPSRRPTFVAGWSHLRVAGASVAALAIVVVVLVSVLKTDRVPTDALRPSPEVAALLALMREESEAPPLDATVRAGETPAPSSVPAQSMNLESAVLEEAGTDDLLDDLSPDEEVALGEMLAKELDEQPGAPRARPLGDQSRRPGAALREPCTATPDVEVL